ncbi:Cell wall assembly/cell proliferation coordinating protein, KNR4-like protein (plasmid) [Emticicia oligotrophica DSM 17448]|uniref:Cell wall assembly/cell proliferation coordinating protein, KNR4-like protein n=1 Tax=Emticicia oligotrophica (strain DSM 17448 / CIP 109782 / MTCC 6937 / GPTSA100-15) TaxID=929562 RepID=A0ABM5N866_EMTOG|nr:SMI1/KNR4 family protein [Emticicia oligotrophica]AFK05703.1 Cell wall assembly/cell proliferation coordinating protein, KNR4-like protein [Emticicia oligotrophica DSM 17448]
MKQLEIILSLNTKERFSSIETLYSINIPNGLKQFIVLYEGKQTIQKVYRRESGIFDSINQFLYLDNENKASIKKIYEGHLFYDIVGFIPFGIDSGGWDYNYSINPDTFGQVWLNKFDSGDEDTLEFVCSSFEKFIDGLITEEEAIKLGY